MTSPKVAVSAFAGTLAYLGPAVTGWGGVSGSRAFMPRSACLGRNSAPNMAPIAAAPAG